MTDVVFVGKLYNTGLEVGGGPMPGGPGGAHPAHPIYNPAYPAHPIYNPAYPDQGLPGAPPVASHPIVLPGAPPGAPGSPSHPIYIPVYPDQGLPGVPPGTWGGVAPPYPDQGLPQPPQGGGTPVPEDVYTPAPIPEELASQHVVSAYDPRTTVWTTKSYPPR